jgi:hypothetical protein
MTTGFGRGPLEGRDGFADAGRGDFDFAFDRFARADAREPLSALFSALFLSLFFFAGLRIPNTLA